MEPMAAGSAYSTLPARAFLSPRAASSTASMLIDAGRASGSGAARPRRGCATPCPAPRRPALGERALVYHADRDRLAVQQLEPLHNSIECPMV